MKKLKRAIIAASLSLVTAGASGSFNVQTSVQAAEVQKVVTEYSDLWTGTVSFKVGETVQWYVHVPEDTTLKGCGATVKIPGLGWGTEERNEDENYLTLEHGDNLVYEFTPDNTGDFVFTCWMGAGCHSNYIHVTEDGSYSVSKPADPANIRTERNGDSIKVSFDAPEVPVGSQITGYKLVLTDKDGKRKKALTDTTTVTVNDLDPDSEYTITAYTLATSGTSAGGNTVNVGTFSEPESVTTNKETATTQTNTGTVTTTAAAKVSGANVSTARTSDNAESPKTGDHGTAGIISVLLASVGAAFLSRKQRT
ncbi:MAG: fibronectin type III domain-containing protein [Ruminococcus sp.]|nr:fibronectin type III domain-containing protein [Ruminococcus sp.]